MKTGKKIKVTKKYNFGSLKITCSEQVLQKSSIVDVQLGCKYASADRYQDASGKAS